MIFKNALFGIVLTISTFTFNLNAIETASTDSNGTAIEGNQQSAAKIVADTIIKIAKINAEAQIEKSKIEAEASENFGLEATRKWAPVLGAAISLWAAFQLGSILSK
jgi:hypothetical protein